jgi:hypothetical protein
MSLKDNIDFSTFSTSEQGFELFGNSIRKSFKYDSYGDRTRFNAQVISNPLPVSPKDVKFFVGSSKKKAGEDVSKLSKFVYRARILGENSPHELLPDPCDSTYASDPEQALKVIAMHTLFVSNIEDGDPSSLPRIGSIVEVQLTKNVFGYNLQYGKHINVVTNPDKEPKGITDCESLRSIVESSDATPGWSYESGEARGGPPLDDPQVIEIYNAYIEKTGGKFAPEAGMCGNLPGFPLAKCKKGKIGTRNVTLHPKFFDIVKRKYDMVKAQNFDEDFNGGDTIRTVQQQISYRIKNAKTPLSLDDYMSAPSGKDGPFDPPTAPIPMGPSRGSRHLYGCAIDFSGILSHGGTTEAKLSNSVARKSETYKYLLTLEEPGFQNYSVEPWHWSVDGN